ncbi:MAG: hypothetical protein ISR65_12130 [Bacteriovoracaceae bacterium]|nr:hypothetical protein [Bacteriovoracaceae bacterium]
MLSWIHTYIFITVIFLAEGSVLFAASTTRQQQASDNIAQWFVHTSSHQHMLSATPLGLSENPDGQNKPFDFLWGLDFGISYMRVPMGQEILDDYGTFGVSENDLPKNLNNFRAHLAKAISNSFDLSGSFLMSEDALLTGWGVGINYNLFNTLVFFTSINFGYSHHVNSDFFDTTNYTIGLAQSINLSWIDLYVGIDYIWGDFEFMENNDSSIPSDTKKINTSSIDKMRKYVGATVTVGDTLRATAQINTTNYETALVLKLSRGWSPAHETSEIEELSKQALKSFDSYVPMVLKFTFPLELFYAPGASFSEMDMNNATSSFLGDSIAIRSGLKLNIFSLLLYLQTSDEDNRKQFYGINQNKKNTEYGALIRAKILGDLYMGVGYGLLGSTITDSGATSSENTFSGVRFFLLGGVSYRFSPRFKGLVEGQYTLSGEYNEVNGSQIEDSISLFGFNLSIGLGYDF